jgi:hypothetical protein
MRSLIWVPLVLLPLAAVTAHCGSTSAPPGWATSGADAAVDGAGGSSGGGSSGNLFGDGSSDGAGGMSSSSGGANACQACQAAGGRCSGGTCTLSDNPGNIDMGTQGLLQGGGTADSSFAWVYPYDKTVFPRGLTPPTLQFAGTTPTAFYVTVTFPGMSYKGYYAANRVRGFALTAADWTAITLAAGPTTAVSVSVTKIAGGKVSGPITETWTIAQGSLKGTIYYETYGSTLVGASALGVGIMAIQPGASAPTVVKSGCANVCHTVSADGSTLVANAGGFDPSTGNITNDHSASYNLKSSASTIFESSTTAFTYGGIYPDGSFVVSATGYRTYPGGAPGLYYTGRKAGTTGGAKINASGFDGVIQQTGTPAFSPDGTMLAYNASGDGMGGESPTLSVMSFDDKTFTFSNARAVADHTDRSGNLNASPTAAWPAFTPDGKWVVYHAGDSPQFETDQGSRGDLWFTSTTSDTHTRLDALDGYSSSGSVYLPAKDAYLSFAPTVLPEAVGGYFWVVFTSHRSYGNTLASKAPLPKDPLLNQSDSDSLGKLWVAAVDINAKGGQDPSHPAFYLDGQELEADNLRGFWVLSPCQANGTSCTTGDECCGGFCQPGDGGGDVCTDTGGGCANLFENCKTASDCCSATDLCINGKCAMAPPQ